MSPEHFNYRTLGHWRGIAALGVMIFHGFGAIRSSGQSVHENLVWLKDLSDFGGFGVHIFFVISGYCIAANVYQLQRRKLGAWEFFRDRALRIYPAYWAACLAAIVANLIASPFNAVSIKDNFPLDWWSAVANVFLIEPYVGVDRLLLLVSWSLVYEIGFYAIVAIGFGLFRVGINIWLLFVGAAVLAVCGLLGWHQGVRYVLKFWPEFLSGSVVFLALWLRAHSLFLARLAILLPILFVLIKALSGSDKGWPGEMVVVAGFSLLLVWLYRWDSQLAAWRGLNWLDWGGAISYSLYLIHVPFGTRVINLASRWVSHDSLWVLPLQICYWLVSIAAAYLFFCFCERPLNNWRGRLKRKAVLLAAVRVA